jgi:hypothetical protein
MPRNLKVNAKLEQPVGIEKYTDYQNTKRLEQIEGIPENISIRILKLILNDGTNCIINGVP